VISPVDRKPSVVTNVTLTIAAADQLYCNFSAPIDDGGSSIISYSVEWYDASNIIVKSVQAIKLSTANVYGGTFTITPPTGQTYPYGVPFDVSADTLKTIIERLPGIGKVSITKNAYTYDDMVSDIDSGIIWSITFLSVDSPVGALMINPSGLISATPKTAQVCHGGVLSLAQILPGCLATESVLGANYPPVLQSGVQPYDVVNLGVGSLGYFSYLIKGLSQSSSDLNGFGVRYMKVFRY
jgi:hypothetical protein